MAVSGADIDELARLARTLDRSADKIRSVLNSASAAASSLGRLWEGPDSADFQRTWMTVHRPRLVGAADGLAQAAATIERNRAAQEQTSSSDTGSRRGPERRGGRRPDAVDAETANEIRTLINKGDDLGISEGELDRVHDLMKDLDPDELQALFDQMSDEELARLFHNVHSSGFWSNDWNDDERADFYQTLEAAGVTNLLDSDPTDDVVLDRLNDEDRRNVVAQRPEVYLDTPAVSDALEDAWVTSNPGTGTDPNRQEQGGWLILDEDGSVRREPWPAGASASITPTTRPDNALGSYHTHPNIGPEWVEEPSAADINWVKAGDDRAPHYVVSANTIWVVNSDGSFEALQSRSTP